MNASFRTNKRILITGTSNDERLLLKEFIAMSKEEGQKVSITSLYDINGDESGLSIEIVEASASNEE